MKTLPPLYNLGFQLNWILSGTLLHESWWAAQEETHNFKDIGAGI